MSIKFDLFPIQPLTAGRFRAWLARSEPGASLQYHRGWLIIDRSPASELTEDVRRNLGSVADAAMRASDKGKIHLVQHRNGPFDFSYLAIKRRDATFLPRALPLQMPAAA